MIELALRVLLSLAVVLGLLWMISRLTSKRLGGRRGGLVQVHARQPLGRSASVNVVTVGGKTLLLGVTENAVNLITELDADAVEQAAIAPVVRLVATDGSADEGDEVATDSDAEVRQAAASTFAAVLAQVDTKNSELGAARRSVVATSIPRPAAHRADGPLAGSLLSPSTWKQSLAAVSGRSVSSR